MKLQLSKHARQRWGLRCSSPVHPELAVAASIKLPFRLAYDRWGRRGISKARRLQVRQRFDYRVSGAVVWVCSESTVLTCWALPAEDLAVVFTWLLTGHWLE